MRILAVLLAGNIAALVAGATDEPVIAGLVGSTEDLQLHAGNNTSFLEAAFTDILGRAIDSGARTFFLNQLAPVSRGRPSRWNS